MRSYTRRGWRERTERRRACCWAAPGLRPKALNPLFPATAGSWQTPADALDLALNRPSSILSDVEKAHVLLLKHSNSLKKKKKKADQRGRQSLQLSGRRSGRGVTRARPLSCALLCSSPAPAASPAPAPSPSPPPAAPPPPGAPQTNLGSKSCVLPPAGPPPARLLPHP